MTESLPKLLNNSPLHEIYFQLRFAPKKPDAGDLLPGLLYAALKEGYSDILSLPLANVPRDFRKQNPNLLYQPSHRLTSGAHSVHIGDQIVNLHTLEYPGWSRFKIEIVSLLEALKGTDYVKQVERFSFKYVNLIAIPQFESQLSRLNMRVEVRGKAPTEKGFVLRTEIHEEKYITIVQIATNAELPIVSGKTPKVSSGLIVEVDTIKEVGNEFWENRDALLEEGHTVAKRIFYSLLTPAALKEMEPEY